MSKQLTQEEFIAKVKSNNKYYAKMTSENNRIKQRLTWCKYEDLPDDYYKKEVV